MKRKNETINHPDHYGGASNPRETIKVIESLGWGEGFRMGSAIKYMMRAGIKGGTRKKEIEDLQKAQWYLDRQVKSLKQGKDIPDED